MAAGGHLHQSTQQGGAHGVTAQPASSAGADSPYSRGPKGVPHSGRPELLHDGLTVGDPPWGLEAGERGGRAAVPIEPVGKRGQDVVSSGKGRHPTTNSS